MNIIDKIQKAISNKIQLGDTLNPLDDYGGVPSINDEGTLENLIEKVDKARGFLKTGKADEDLSRYFPNILPVTRQQQIAGEIPSKAYASVMYTGKKQFEFILIKMVKVLPLTFQQCFGPFTMLLVEGSYETGLFRHLCIESKFRKFKKKIRNIFLL